MTCTDTEGMVRRIGGKSIGLGWLTEIASVYSRYALRMAWHSHREAEVICCLKGEMTYEFRGHRRVTLKAGEFLVIPPEADHRLSHGIDAPSRRISFLVRPGRQVRSGLSPFSAKTRSELLSRLLDKRFLPHRLPPSAHDHLRRLGEFLHRPRTGLSEIESCEARLHVCQLYFTCSVQAQARPSDESKIMQQAVDWIRQHAAEPIRLSDLIARIGYGRTQFFRLFKEKTGLSPGDFIIQQRIHAALALLEKGDLPVQRIAAAVGFSDATFFSRTFRNRIGSTPLKWRQEHRKRR